MYMDQRKWSFLSASKKHFPVRVGGDAVAAAVLLEAETIFDSAHAKIHIVASTKGDREESEGREGRRGRRQIHAGRRDRRVCKCSTRGRDAVMEGKNCLFQRPAFSQSHYPRPVI